jgi:2-methylcitrate dehydratase PrpD
MSRTSAALLLARHVHRFQPHALTDDVREAVARCVLDLLAAAGSGFAASGPTAAREGAKALFGPGESDIWFAGGTAHPTAALLSNSAASAALDLDDGSRPARGHPGAAAIPAAWAALGVQHSTEDFMCAVVAGYEAGLRVALGRLAYAPSGAWAPYAAVGAAGRLWGASPDTLAQAFAIAAQSAPALPGLAGLMGSDVKEGIPWGSVTGLAALQLAQAGFTGPTQIFDQPQLFDAGRMLSNLEGAPLITQTYFKPYACCRHIHAPVEAYLALADRHGFAVDQVAHVTVRTYHATFNLSNTAAPATPVDAQYSTPFCLAAAAVHGPQALVPMSEALLHDLRVLEFAEKVQVEQDPEIERLFPARSPARVQVITSRGTFQSDITDARGDPATPLSWEELEAKFRTATRACMPAQRQQELLLAARRFRRGDISDLRRAIRASP